MNILIPASAIVATIKIAIKSFLFLVIICDYKLKTVLQKSIVVSKLDNAFPTIYYKYIYWAKGYFIAKIT